jgi:RNA polymerase sigma-70 factor (ECF subfamily)
MQTMETPLKDLQDDDLIKETLMGNREVFGILVRKYKDSLYDLACRILGNKQEAEDVLQDAFVEAYRHLADFNHRSKFSTWLYSIVLNRVRNRLRRNKTIRWYSLDASANQDEDSRVMEMPDEGPSVQSMTENKLFLEAIQKAASTLPLTYRSIFILHYMQNLPLQDIAKRLGRPTGTVKVYLHRARKLLYRRLSSEVRAAMGIAA